MDATRLDYAPSTAWYKRRRLRAFVAIVVPLLLLLPLGWLAGPRAWRHAKLLYWQHRAMNDSAPATHLVYTDDEPQARRLVLANDAFDEQTGLFRSGALNMNPAWNRFAELARLDVAMEATLFIHNRRNSHGADRLVVVERGIPCDVEDGTVSPDTQHLVSVIWRVIRPGSVFRAPVERNGRSQKIDLETFVSPQPIRWFAGQIDPADDSHFTLQFQAGPKRGLVDGWLRDDDTVELSPRHRTPD